MSRSGCKVLILQRIAIICSVFNKCFRIAGVDTSSNLALERARGRKPRGIVVEESVV